MEARPTRFTSRHESPPVNLQCMQGQCPPSTVDQVTQSLGTASISDPIEYATQGRGMLTFPVNGPDLIGEMFKKFWIAAHKNKAVDGGWS